MMDAMMSTPLSEADPEIYRLIASERTRQHCGLSLVASENLTSASVLKTLSSCLTNKYCEGLPNPRDHGSNRYLDRIEHLCQERALQAFNLPPTEWGVNVQPYSGTPANNVVYMALLRPHDRIMYLDLLDGGHVSHGNMTLEERLSRASVFYETMPYKVNPRTGLIDYDKFARTARLFKPKLIIAGSASYSRYLNYKKFRRISDEVGAFLLADAGQIAGLVQAEVIYSPFHHCDIVSIATHHTLRGPRAGIVFYRKGVRSVSQDGNTVMYDLPQRLGQGVFPGLDQSHNPTISRVRSASQDGNTVMYDLPQSLGQGVRSVSQDGNTVMYDLPQSLGQGVRSVSQDGNTVMYDLPQRLGQGVFPGLDQSHNPTISRVFQA
ncbi:serine hydroxymethyltransferase-like [Macrosteles quadrilineatus]|uniref:serine hydroxymethyltransferase-like n=1 Tax=Macrosteles quadrilineatus TaxID=74068 RepID=UPI0023E0C3B5|nr:serine hydroxymethyltransferase-like [Macrosteles quadrilineatus]